MTTHLDDRCNVKPAIESLTYQGNELHAKITEVVRFLRVESKYDTDAILQSMFSEYVRIRTGMNIQLKIMEDPRLVDNACVYLPRITKDHPFTKVFEHRVTPTTSGPLLTKLKMGKSKGGVDLENGRVTGIYCEVPAEVWVEQSLFDENKYTAEEVAAIIVHETGHVFTYFQYIHTMGYGGFISLTAAREYAGIQDPKQRELIVQSASDILGLDAHTVEQCISSPSDGESLLLREYTTKLVSNTGNNLYDFRNVEQLADQYCVKHGCGSHLAPALTKMYRRYGDTSTSFTAYLSSELTGYLMFFGGLAMAATAGPMTPLFIAARTAVAMYMMLLLKNPGVRVYDTPEARVKNLKTMLTQDLRTMRKLGNDEQVKKIIEQIDYIEEASKALKDRRSLVEIYWESIPGLAMTSAQQEKAAKQLESLLFNELHYHSAKFDQLANH